MPVTSTPPFSRWLFLLLSCLSLSPALAATENHDRWYVLRMQDQRAGWLHDRRDTAGDQITTRSTIHLELKRGSQTVTVSVESEFVETTDGTPVSMKLTQRLGAEPTTERFTFTKDAVRVTSSGGRTSERERPPGQWLTPAAASRFIRQRLEAGAKEITLRAIDPASGIDPVMYTNRVQERTHVEALGKTVPAVKWLVSTDRHPDVSTLEFVDERGVPIRSETSLGGLKVEIILADRDLAMSKLDAPEILVSTLVTPSRPIKNPRAVRRAEYLLTLPGAALPDLPFGRVQSVALRDASTARVTVDTDGTRTIENHDQPVDTQRLPSALVASDDAEVKRLADRAKGETPSARAESMRRLVHTHVKQKNLGVGFASAAEVARTRTGDCTEHAVLLAAMLRAADIPSRVVSGVIYAEHFEGADNVFGYHMWTQAWTGDAWLDLDPTLAPDMPFDATHIALATSNLEDGATTNALVSLVPMLGKLKIEVLSTSPSSP